MTTLAAMNDQTFMREALSAGRSAVGRTGDNPAVGCVLVRQGMIVARGATHPPGDNHAEVAAIKAAEAAGVPVSECDLYVTLEPCSFHGRTPACATLIATKRPKRVFIAVRDPHPRVRGTGVALLQAAGIEVIEGVLEQEARLELAAWFAQWPEAV